MSAHSPTPWCVSEVHNGLVSSADGGTVADCVAIAPRPEADATRIVECVNACAELPEPEQLSRAIERCRHVLTVPIERLNPASHELARFLLTQLGAELGSFGAELEAERDRRREHAADLHAAGLDPMVAGVAAGLLDKLDGPQIELDGPDRPNDTSDLGDKGGAR